MPAPRVTERETARQACSARRAQLLGDIIDGLITVDEAANDAEQARLLAEFEALA